MESKRVIDQLYIRHNDHIIQGAEPIVYKNGHKKALVFIHGHMETPAVWSEIVELGKHTNAFDIYAPLLPYHGRTLETASLLDNKIIYNYIKNYISKLSGEYEHLTVVGLSYGGLQLLNLAKNQDLPKNVYPILYGPATYIRSNNWQGWLKAYLYQTLFRNYCNYDSIGCAYPVYDSADERGKELIEKEISLRYRVLPAILQMYDFDSATRGAIKRIKNPFSVLIAEDDNRVDYQKVKEECAANSKCRFVSFPSGKHVIHYGKWKEKFFEVITKKYNKSIGKTYDKP